MNSSNYTVGAKNAESGATNAGSYNVYYYATGNGNYNPTSGNLYVTSSISKASCPTSMWAVGNLSYNGGEQAIAWVSNWVGDTYISIGTELNASNYTTARWWVWDRAVYTNAMSNWVYWYVPETTNYYAGSGRVWCSIGKATGSVSSVSVTGTAKVGQTLTASAEYTGDGAITYTWYRTDSSTATSGTSLGTGATYTCVSNDVGKYIRCNATLAAGTNYNGDSTGKWGGTSAAVEHNVVLKTFTGTRSLSGDIYSSAYDGIAYVGAIFSGLSQYLYIQPGSRK